jgi:ribosomal protein L21
MYAVVELQGHKYIVSEKAEIIVDNVDQAQGQKLVADKVLAVFDEKGSDVKV